MAVRIGLIHATPVSLEPIQSAFAAHWPDAALMNILDDSLSQDRMGSAELTPEMIGRFERLARYAVDYGANAVLFTCSAFGPAIEAAARAVAVPVLKPNEAMFDAALEQGGRVGMVVTFGPSVAPMTREFHEAARQHAREATLTTVLADGAMDALRRGNVELHNRLVAQAAQTLSDVDVIMLAQFSTSRALDAVAARIGVPVLTAPTAAIAQLRSKLPS